MLPPLILICIAPSPRFAVLCCRSRTVQYGLKYYAMNAALLTLIIALQANFSLTSWHPVFVVGAAHHASAFGKQPTPEGSSRITCCMSALHNVATSLRSADMTLALPVMSALCSACTAVQKHTLSSKHPVYTQPAAGALFTNLSISLALMCRQPPST